MPISGPFSRIRYDSSTFLRRNTKKIAVLAVYVLITLFCVTSFSQDNQQNNEQCQTYNIPEIIAKLDRLLIEAKFDIKALDRYDELWESLPEEVQQEIKALEEAKKNAENLWPDDEDLLGESEDSWASSTGSLLNTIAQADDQNTSSQDQSYAYR